MKIVCLLIWMVQVNFVFSEKKQLNLMGLLPMTGNLFRGGKACLLAANLALRHVNARDDVLDEFKLNLIWRDTKCASGPAVNKMFEMLYQEPTKIMVFGPGCSTEAEVTAQATPDWNLTTISWGAGSPELSDKSKYPRFFRVTAPATRLNVARIELARLFNWKKLGIIHYGAEYFSSETDHLVDLMKDDDMYVISEEIFNHDPLPRVQNLKKKDARIIVAGGYASHGKRILCAAYRAGLYGPKIVWMFPGYYRDYWWTSKSPEVPCTAEQMELVAEGSILASFPFSSIKEERGVANLTVSEYTKLYRQEEDYQYITDYEYISPRCYDGIWVTALTLNCTNQILLETGSNKSLDQFQYSDKDIADTITACASKVSFVGLNGLIEFDKFGDPSINVQISQIQGGKKILVGIYRTDVDDPFIEFYNGGITWKEGMVPRDSTLVTEIEEVIPRHLYVMMSCFAGFGIILASSLVVFNVINRNNRFVKLSSPNINNVLLLGCIVTYTSVFMESLERKQVLLCKLQTYTFLVGFSMSFGALFSKTWRVYRIFANKKRIQIRIRDYQLIGIVIGLVGVLCFVLILWEAIDPLVIHIQYLESKIDLIGNDAEVHPYIRLCTSSYYSYFAWTIYIMEGTLLAFGAFLAFETRKVKLEALNDSRLIGICLYNVVVLSAVSLTLNLVLEERVGLIYGINSGVLIIGTTATQLVVFIPKIQEVYFPHRIDRDTSETIDTSRHGNNSTLNSNKTTSQITTTRETLVSKTTSSSC